MGPDPKIVLKGLIWKVKGTTKGGTLLPDWTIQDRYVLKAYTNDASNELKSLTYVVGDSKLMQKWKADWLKFKDHDTTVATAMPYHRPGAPVPVQSQATKQISNPDNGSGERVNPLKQMAAYCRYGETRYCYVVTQAELVAMRIRRISGQGDGKLHAAVEYRAIPWSNHGPGKLTANMGIWALACMGMSNLNCLPPCDGCLGGRFGSRDSLFCS